MATNMKTNMRICFEKMVGVGVNFFGFVKSSMHLWPYLVDVLSESSHVGEIRIRNPQREFKIQETASLATKAEFTNAQISETLTAYPITLGVKTKECCTWMPHGQTKWEEANDGETTSKCGVMTNKHREFSKRKENVFCKQ